MPTKARFDLGSLGFSTRRITLTAASTSAIPKLDASATSLSKILASAAECSKFSHNARIPEPIRLSPRYIMNGFVPKNALAALTAWAKPRGSSWTMYSTFIAQLPPLLTASWIALPDSGEMIIPTSRTPASERLSRT